MKNVTLTIIALLIISGCAGIPASNQTQGTLAGGALGAVLGSTIGDGRGAVWAAAAGAIGGALAGSHIGKRLDQRDQFAMQKATMTALERSKSNATINWSNPDTGNMGTVTPTRTFQMVDGSYCREYTSMVEVAGESEILYGTACRQTDGSWKNVS